MGRLPAEDGELSVVPGQETGRDAHVRAPVLREWLIWREEGEKTKFPLRSQV